MRAPYQAAGTHHTCSDVRGKERQMRLTLPRSQPPPSLSPLPPARRQAGAHEESPGSPATCNHHLRNSKPALSIFINTSPASNGSASPRRLFSSPRPLRQNRPPRPRLTRPSILGPKLASYAPPSLSLRCRSPVAVSLYVLHLVPPDYEQSLFPPSERAVARTPTRPSPLHFLDSRSIISRRT